MLFLSLLLQVFTLVEWNCENLFDCERDSVSDDTEWLPDSYHHWTHYRYWQKLNNVGRTLLACGEADKWHLPDVVVLTEVENDSVLTDLTRKSLLRGARYNYIMTNSPDVRGIDVAVLYAPFTFRPVSSHALRIRPLKGMRPTRDILYVAGELISGDTLHLFALHAPSRYGGERQTRPHRMAVAQRLTAAIDSITAIQPDAKIMVTGDFNDYVKSHSLRYLCSHGLTNLSAQFKSEGKVKGTYKFKGEWNSLDHLLASQSAVQLFVDGRVAAFPFLLTDDATYGGQKPRRNYEGPRWQNGFSDHLPLVARFQLTNCKRNGNN